MSRTTFILAAALSTSLAVAPPRRRLRDTVDIGHVRRMRAEQTETPTALLDCSFASRRRASGLMPG